MDSEQEFLPCNRILVINDTYTEVTLKVGRVSKSLTQALVLCVFLCPVVLRAVLVFPRGNVPLLTRHGNRANSEIACRCNKDNSVTISV